MLHFSLDDLSPGTLLDDVATAELIGVHPTTMRRWRNTGVGPPYMRVSTACIRYKVADLRAYLESRRVVA